MSVELPGELVRLARAEAARQDALAGRASHRMAIGAWLRVALEEATARAPEAPDRPTDQVLSPRRTRGATRA